MGGSSVPSSTTQTTMLDPTRQAALKNAMGYFDKWASNYKGPTYKGPLTAGRTSDWYAAQDMAHRMANRFSEGGLASMRRFDDGGTTSITLGGGDSAPINPNPGLILGGPNLPTSAPEVQPVTSTGSITLGSPASTYSAPINPNPGLILGGPNLPTSAPVAQPVTSTGAVTLSSPTNTSGLGSLSNIGSANTGGVPVKTAAELAAEQAAKDAAEQAARDAALKKAIADAKLTPANVTPTVTSTNMGSPYLLGQALTLGGAGSAFRLGSDITPKQIYNSYNTPDQFTPDIWDKTAMDTYMSPYTQGVVDIALREAARQRGIERLKENTAATQSGAFGGYRQGVVEAEGERNYNQLLNDIETKGLQNAYTDAATQFAADRNAKQAAYNANQQALQAAATGDINAGQLNQANKFQAFTNQLAALNQGVNNVQNLSALETAYQNAMGNSAAALNSTDASAAARDQAQYDALMKVLTEIGNVDLVKFQKLVEGAGVGSGNNSNTQVRVTGSAV